MEDIGIAVSEIILTKDMNEEQKQEFCRRNNIDSILIVDNCPYPKDENGRSIFPTTNGIASDDISIAAIKQQDDKIKTLEETIIKQNQLLEQIIKRLTK